MPPEVKKLIAAYPDQMLNLSNNHVVFCDSSRLLFDDGKQKTIEDLLKY
jgi:hypothetical protein